MGKNAQNPTAAPTAQETHTPSAGMPIDGEFNITDSELVNGPHLLKPAGKEIMIVHENRAPVLDVYTAAAEFTNHTGLFFDRNARHWYRLVPGKSYAEETVSVADVHHMIWTFLLKRTKDRWFVAHNQQTFFRFLCTLDLGPEHHVDSDCSGWTRRYIVTARQFDHSSETGVVTSILAKLYVHFCRKENLDINQNFLASPRAIEMAISRALEQQHPGAGRTNGNGAGRVIMFDPLSGEIRRGRGFYGLRVTTDLLESLSTNLATSPERSDTAQIAAI